MTGEWVTLDGTHGVCTLTLNRPEVLNALSTVLCRQATAALERVAADPGRAS